MTHSNFCHDESESLHTITCECPAEATQPQIQSPIAPRVIAITSGKGGIGKTHATINIGLALAKLKKQVLLLDADLGLANINVMLGFKPGPTLKEFFLAKSQLSDLIVRYSDRLHVIPAASGVPELTHLSANERLLLLNAIEELPTTYDYMLIDTAAGIGDNVMYFTSSAEEIIVVIDQEPTSITDAYALIKVLSGRYHRKEFDIIVNKVPHTSDGRNAYAQLANAAEHFLSARLRFLGTISEDDSVSEAVIKQKPFFQVFPSCNASRDIQQLARKINSDVENRAIRGGLQFFFNSLLRTPLAAVIPD